jgi:hypothetical protein
MSPIENCCVLWLLTFAVVLMSWHFTVLTRTICRRGVLLVWSAWAGRAVHDARQPEKDTGKHYAGAYLLQY